MFHIPFVDTLDAKNYEKSATILLEMPAHEISCNNWPKEYPYTPRIEFRMAHNGENLFLIFDVDESYTRAIIEEDNGNVWTDSCVEFFIALDDDGYYNFETTPIGKMLMAHRPERTKPTYAEPEVMATVKRIGTMGTKPFAEIEGRNCWSMMLVIPAKALFKHKLDTWKGVEARMNLYKCGDELSHPHFLSWKPIGTPQPDFHRPEYFGDVVFD